MNQAIYTALNALILLAIGASAFVWIELLRDRLSRRPDNFLDSILPPRDRGRPQWGLADSLAMPLVMLASMALASEFIRMGLVSQGWMEARTTNGETQSLTAANLVGSIVAVSAGGLLGIAVVVALLRRFDSDAVRKLGLTFSVPDLWLGLRAALLILPPVLLVNLIVVMYVPYEHEVLNSLAAVSTPLVLVATIVGTVVVTPVVEEFLVRGLLQGGLQRAADRDLEDNQNGLGGNAETSVKPHALWPVVIASLVFSLLHLGQGAAPIPLFVLSLGLGYLYRQTGSLFPSIVVHMVLNGMTIFIEIVKPSVS